MQISNADWISWVPSNGFLTNTTSTKMACDGFIWSSRHLAFFCLAAWCYWECQYGEDYHTVCQGSVWWQYKVQCASMEKNSTAHCEVHHFWEPKRSGRQASILEVFSLNTCWVPVATSYSFMTSTVGTWLCPRINSQFSCVFMVVFC